VKHLWLRPDVRVNDGAINATTRLDPWIVGAGIRYRF
jgi:outer membrane protein